MTTNTDYTPTEPNYNWDRIMSTSSIKTHRLFLINLERYIPDKDTFYQIIKVFKENEDKRPPKTSFREFIGAIAYMVIYEQDPRIAPIDIVTAAGNEFSKGDLMETAGKVQYETEIHNPFVYLDRLKNIAGEEQKEVEEAITYLPSEILNEYDDHHEAIVGAAIHIALDESVGAICYDRLNGNLLPETLDSIVEQLDNRTFEEKWEEFASDLDGELRPEFDTVSLEDAKLAVEIEKTYGIGKWFPTSAIDDDKLPFPVEEHIRALERIGMLDEENDTCQLVQSCFQ
ncbi:hypothetical protein NP511_17955 [Natrinema thermotolerans]|uniref:Uncharacterized protein n=1 Tax=Natrinema thermotolerans TaxID=121872 RepID=A0AAF0T0Q5_9EURY|nr:hypothetical protein [Natrinema thermotolerans]QCC60241.1 hypothetical protein DVR14_17025 [Natrinema thermotolerans]QCC61153.1 hypothetical protein DVR14_21155 [Natrinema thermotolerans]WMT07260.1 hypothetical protein NP511_17955 [Natrinema thermotolerans]